MVRFTEEQRAKIVDLYFSCNSSIIAVQRSYRNICNFSALWGYLKLKVYIDKHNILQGLKLKIIQEDYSHLWSFAGIKTPEMLNAVMNSVIKRVRLCLTNNGNHLKDIIFHA